MDSSGIRLSRAAFLGGTAAYAAAASLPGTASAAAVSAVTPAAALARLEAGNARFVSGDLHNPSNIVERREALAGGQSPFATILTCSDSRTAPELIFDVHVGELFVVRLAGNYVENNGLGTIEYGLEHLGSSLLVILGHSNCGAVKATYDTIQSGNPLPPHLDALAKAIGPGIEAVVKRGGSLDEAVAANVHAQVIAATMHSDVLAHGVSAGKLRIVGATYGLHSGRVTLI
jgi:carbonic anhydrase